MKVLLAVDLSYQSYRASASHPGLTSGRYFTGGVFGFFTSLAKAIRETRATRVVVCADTKPYLRSRDYPDYKQLRRATADELLLKAHKQSMRLIAEGLAVLGIPVWALQGFESDDLIAHAVRRYRGRFTRIYAASNDSDLCQLLDWQGFALYKTSIAELVTAASLLETTGLTPAEFMLATALQGTHNDIAGIPRVGEVLSRRAVKDPGLMRKYRDGWASVIDRNLALIRLPHLEFPGDAELPASAGVYAHRDFIRWCARYDIEVTGSMAQSFERVLQG